MTEAQFIAMANDVFEKGATYERLSALYRNTYERGNLEEKLKESERRETALRNEISVLEGILNNHKVANKNLSFQLEELTIRFRAKLLGAYYMINSFTYQSTHRDKRIVVDSIKQVLETMINEGDKMPFKFEQLDDLPF